MIFISASEVKGLIEVYSQRDPPHGSACHMKFFFILKRAHCIYTVSGLTSAMAENQTTCAFTCWDGGAKLPLHVQHCTGMWLRGNGNKIYEDGSKRKEKTWCLILNDIELEECRSEVKRVLFEVGRELGRGCGKRSKSKMEECALWWKGFWGTKEATGSVWCCTEQTGPSLSLISWSGGLATFILFSFLSLPPLLPYMS